MSLLPFLLSEYLEELQHPQNPLLLNVCPEQPPARTSHVHLNLLPQQKSTLEQLKNLTELLQQHKNNNLSTRPPPSVNKDDFQVVLDVQQFEPQEIEVKVVDNFLVVTAKHEDKRDEHGWVSRQFTRKYKLPEDSNVEQLTSRLSSDGLLMIVAPKKRSSNEETERTIQIEHTGKPFINEQREQSKKSNQNDEEKQTK